MPYAKRKGDKTKYYVVARECIARSCFQPGHYQHRGASGGGNGTHATGQVSPCCLCNAYRGCPAEKGETPELLKERKDEGWKAEG